MPRRPCLGPPGSEECPTRSLTEPGKPRCRDCTRATDAARGTRQQRGYDRTYDQARAALHLELRPPCHWGCGRPATTADHWPPQAVATADTQLVLLPACQPCNSGQVALQHWRSLHPDT